MFNVFVKVSDIVMPHWRDTIFSVSSDSAQNMTSLDWGIVSFIGKAVSPDCTLIWAWCGSHQLDIFFQKVVSKLCENEFYTTLTSLIVYLLRYFTFISEVGSKCPTVGTPSWLSLVRVLKWLVRYRSKSMKYIDTNNPSCRPSVSWCIPSLLMYGVTAEVEVLFTSL